VRLVWVFSGGWSIWCFAVYRRLVLVAVLYPICWFFCNISYPALVCARCMLALPSATPGMPYAVHVRALGISTSGRSLSRVTPTVRSVRMQVALRKHVRSPPTRSTATPRRPTWARDLFFLMYDHVCADSLAASIPHREAVPTPLDMGAIEGVGKYIVALRHMPPRSRRRRKYKTQS
jgi:hypothetical protein